MVAGLFFCDGALDEGDEVGVSASAPHDSVEVVVGLREEAGADLSVGREADAAALAAEGLRDGRDDADFSYAVVEGVADGGFAERVRLQCELRGERFRAAR